MEQKERIASIKETVPGNVTLVAVSKTRTVDEITNVYDTGHLDFGENKVQEITDKFEQLPKDIRWHLIGHLQTNKVKYIASFVHLIHSVDSLKLLAEIDKHASKANRSIGCLIQVHIAEEESKFGMSYSEAETFFKEKHYLKCKNVKVEGLMGMATNTENEEKVREEFRKLKLFFDEVSKQYLKLNVLSMGMSQDYKIAIEEGSTMVRIGSAIFGERNY